MYKIIGTTNRRMLVRRSISLLSLMAAVMVIFMFGCRDALDTNLDTNMPPDTYVTGAPMESTIAFYKVHLFWYGNDVDGVVTGYEYTITDSVPADEDTLTFAYTTRTDSIFSIPVEGNQQVVGHRFYVRAIDNEGAEDPEPAFAFFGVSDLNPPVPVFKYARAVKDENVDFPDDWPFSDTIMVEGSDLVSPADTIPAGYGLEFEWEGYDSDSMIIETGEVVPAGYVEQFEYLLRGRDNSPTLVGSDVTELVLDNEDMTAGLFALQLRAVDDAGFMGLSPEIRSFMWNHDPKTYFQKGWEEGMTDSLPVVIASCPSVWGEGVTRAFYLGDTIPVNYSAERIGLDLEFVVWGTDSDDYTGEGVRSFEYKIGAARFNTAGIHAEPNHGTISLRERTVSQTISARCADRWGKKSGKLATYRLVINQSPILRDTVDVVEGEPILRFPMANQPIPADSIAAWGNRLFVRTRAFDPDSTQTRFQYEFRIAPRGSRLPIGTSGTREEGVYEVSLELPNGYIETGDTLITFIEEYRTGRETSISTPLVIAR